MAEHLITEALDSNRWEGLDLAEQSATRERLFLAWINEEPQRATLYPRLSPEEQQAARRRFDARLEERRPDVFIIKTQEEIKETIPAQPLGGGFMGPGVSERDVVKQERRTRPMLSPPEEALISAMKSGKLNPKIVEPERLPDFIEFARYTLSDKEAEKWRKAGDELATELGFPRGLTKGREFVKGIVPFGIMDLIQKKLAKDDSRLALVQKLEKSARSDLEWFQTAGAFVGLFGGAIGLGRWAVSKGLSIVSRVALADVVPAVAYSEKLPGIARGYLKERNIGGPTTQYLAEVTEAAALGVVGELLMAKVLKKPAKEVFDVYGEHGEAARRAFARLEEIDKRFFDPDDQWGVTRGASYIGQPISTVLANINPKIRLAMKGHIWNELVATEADIERVLPFLKKKRKAFRFKKAEREAFDLAEKNRDTVKIDATARKYDFTREYEAKQRVLMRIYRDATQAGVDVNYLERFAPRRIKDFRLFERLVGDIEGELGDTIRGRIAKATGEAKDPQTAFGFYKLPDEIKAKIAIREVDDALGNIGGFPESIRRPGIFRERQIKIVSKRLNKAYYTSDETLIKYIHSARRAIERRKFFGEHAKMNSAEIFSEEVAAKNVEQSIGSWTGELFRKGQITSTQEERLKSILESFFKYKQMSKGMAAFRDVNLLSILTHPAQALTQLGDLYTSVYSNGLYRTMKAALGVPFRRGVKMKNLHITRMGAEFANPGQLAKTTNTAMFMLRGIDQFGKEVRFNSTLSRLFWEASRPGISPHRARLAKELDFTFGKEAAEVMGDLSNRKITQNVKFMLFNDIANVQPTTLLEVPQAYLDLPNGRILYQLKTFTIKQIDIINREALQELERGHIGTAVENMIKLTASFMLFGAGADMIKDLSLGKELDLSDIVIENAWKSIGPSKWTVDRAKDEGVYVALREYIFPPGKLLEGAWNDIGKAMKKEFELQNSESVRSLPWFGEIYYWWLGRGHEKTEERLRKKVLRSYR